MSWFWGKKQTQDPTKSLDSDLKDFLDSQQPRPYIPTGHKVPLGAKKPEVNNDEAAKEAAAPEDRPLPAESLFQDGRYKHLWKSYVPQRDVVEANTTPAQRLLDAKKDRKASLSQAALENCAFEEELKRTCFQEGDAVNRIRARLTMCSRETKAFNRCFQLQAKFLQALGYRGSAFSSNEEDERIQMHADKLYHRMMDYEAAVDEAKAKGQPIPPLTSVFNPNRPAPTIDEINLPQGLARGLKRPLHELPAHEREVAARAVLQETKIAQTYADDFFKYTTTLNEGRQERQKKLVDLFGDTLGKFFVPDAPDQSEIPTFDPTKLDRDFWKDDPPISKVTSAPVTKG
ncbi:hypothetical protein H2198_005239 [Neophaeococcomyces mojaviensis]|uniref:Uncharacterized protein n=1 Tax=Neophaeococcomyces mojaviensis TaxID=3383035 RepID=A0ACC3A6M8_9EURO|nr:hypothetical protein H2198_005239 [Knufia sp. JES_112]